ncbi:MAG: anti-sigma factor [Tenuifilaceae bacterium]
MNLNRQNYEVFLIDYLDGKLSPLESAELMAFLETNPDIKNELDGLRDVVLIDEPLSFPNKSDLKKKSFLKNGIDNEFDYLCITSIEGEDSLEEKKILDSLIKVDPKKENDFITFQKTKITPEKSIIYKEKEYLKRAKIVPIRLSTLRLATGIAASIAIILTVYGVFNITKDAKQVDNISKNLTPVIIEKKLETKVAEQKPIEIILSQEIKPENKLIAYNKEEEVKPIISEVQKITDREETPTIINRIEPKIILSPYLINDDRIALAIINPNHQSNFMASNNPIQLGYYNQYNTKEIGVFEIIQYGIKSFGRLIGKDVKLEADRDKNGKIKKINFETDLIAFSAPIGKKE